MRKAYKRERDEYIVKEAAMGKPEIDIATELLMSRKRVHDIILEHERRARVRAYLQQGV